MIYKHLGQRRQVAGIESDAGRIRSSGKVEHRIENVTLAQPRCDATPRDAVCMFGHRRELNNPKAVPLTKLADAFTGLDSPESENELQIHKVIDKPSGF